jgi:hypothetical protein
MIVTERKRSLLRVNRSVAFVSCSRQARLSSGYSPVNITSVETVWMNTAGLTLRRAMF